MKFNKIRMEMTPNGDNEFERAIAYEFEYDPNEGIEEIVDGFRVFLRALTYHQKTIDKYVPDPEDVEEEPFDEAFDRIVQQPIPAPIPVYPYVVQPGAPTVPTKNIEITCCDNSNKLTEE